MTDSEQEASTATCPVCGQEYDHYRDETSGSNTVLRDDATACRVKKGSNSFAGRRDWKVYVHVGNEQTSVAEHLSEMTGRPVEDFEWDGEVSDLPHPDELESVDHD